MGWAVPGIAPLAWLVWQRTLLCVRGQVDCGQVKDEEFGNHCTSFPSLSFQKLTECRRQVQPRKLLCPPAMALPHTREAALSTQGHQIGSSPGSPKMDVAQ